MSYVIASVHEGEFILRLEPPPPKKKPTQLGRSWVPRGALGQNKAPKKGPNVGNTNLASRVLSKRARRRCGVCV